MKTSCDFEDVKTRVETTLGKILRAKVSINNDDPRIASIHKALCQTYEAGGKGIILEEELIPLIRKHYNYKAVLCPNQIN